MQDVQARILVLHPSARPNIDFIVCADPDDPGEEIITGWDEDVLGPRDEAALAAVHVAGTSLADYARAKSYAIRVGGANIAGVSVKTDSDSLGLINGMFVLSQQDPSATFKFDTGASVVALNATQVATLATAVGRWVQSTFSARADVLSQITAGTITTTTEIDAYAWPSNS